MPKPIVLNRDGRISQFQLSRVDRTKLYGRRRRIPLDPAGKACGRAALTEDGALLLRPGMTAQGYFDEAGTWVPNKTLVGLSAEGEVLEKVPSTLGGERPLVGPVPASELLDTRVSAIYALTAESGDGDGDGDEGEEAAALDDDLLASLRGGDLYRFEFNYRADYRAETAFLIANDDGEVFALVGQPVETDWVDPAEAIVASFDDADDDDDLDFEMF